MYSRRTFQQCWYKWLCQYFGCSNDISFETMLGGGVLSEDTQHRSPRHRCKSASTSFDYKNILINYQVYSSFIIQSVIANIVAIALISMGTWPCYRRMRLRCTSRLLLWLSSISTKLSVTSRVQYRSWLWLSIIRAKALTASIAIKM